MKENMTRFGAGIEPDDDSWLRELREFYHNFPQAFGETWRIVESMSVSSLGKTPALWKVNGDELIFTKWLSASSELLPTIVAWYLAIRSYRWTLTGKRRGVDLKSTVWTAGFPVNNSEICLGQEIVRERKTDSSMSSAQIQIEMRERYFAEFEAKERSSMPDGAKRNQSNIVLDFVGPSMDIGFRLRELASPRKMIVSLDVAYLFCHSPSLRGQDSDHNIDVLLGDGELYTDWKDSASELTTAYGEFRSGHGKFLFFQGKESLKGVLRGVPYPVFWLDVFKGNKLTKAEDELTGRKPVDTEYAKIYCGEFFEDRRLKLFRPFIFNDSASGDRPPDDYYEKFKAIVDPALENHLKRRKIQSDPNPVGPGGTHASDAEVDEFVSKMPSPKD